MQNVEIVVNGISFSVDYNLLAAITNSFPSESQYADLGRQLVALGINSITENLVYNMEYDQELFDRIWESGDLQLKRVLLENSDFFENLTDSQAQEALDSNDVEICCILARNCEKLIYSAKRLSADVGAPIVEALAHNEHLEVRHSFLHNPDLPEKFMPDFAKLVTENIAEPDSAAIATMQESALNLLPRVSRSLLLSLADNIDAIENKKVKKSVALYLATHPDPAIRIALAANPNTPKSAFDILLADSEPDVVAEAKDSLDIAEDDE